jgi:hypothetical protein
VKGPYGGVQETIGREKGEYDWSTYMPVCHVEVIILYN